MESAVLLHHVSTVAQNGQTKREIRVVVNCNITNVSPQIPHTAPLISVSLYIVL